MLHLVDVKETVGISLGLCSSHKEAQRAWFGTCTLALKDTAQYDFTIAIGYDGGNTVDAAQVLEGWKKMRRRIARLWYLDTLFLKFRLSREMYDFVRSIYPVLEELWTSGQKVDYQVDGMQTWEPLSNVLERLKYVISRALRRLNRASDLKFVGTRSKRKIVHRGGLTKNLLTRENMAGPC